MNKLQLTENLAAKLGITHSEAERMVNEFVNMVYSVLSKDGVVNISGFGKFSVSHRASRIGVNPRNPSQKLTIGALNTPKFKAGEAFKKAVELKNPEPTPAN